MLIVVVKFVLVVVVDDVVEFFVTRVVEDVKVVVFYCTKVDGEDDEEVRPVVQHFEYCMIF